MKTHSVCAGVLGGVLAVGGCGVRTLPPPRVPERLLPVPAVEIGPAQPGESTLLVDTVGPSKQVTEVVGMISTVVAGQGGTATGYGVATRPLCATPCAVHLAPGQHSLQFTDATTGEWAGEARIQIAQGTTAFRVAPGHRKISGGFFGGVALGSVGLIGALVAGTTWAIEGGDGAGYALAVSAGLTVIGGLLMHTYRPEQQDASVVQWSLSSTTVGSR